MYWEGEIEREGGRDREREREGGRDREIEREGGIERERKGGREGSHTLRGLSRDDTIRSKFSWRIKLIPTNSQSTVTIVRHAHSCRRTGSRTSWHVSEGLVPEDKDVKDSLTEREED